jgi:hypothetical protein
MINSYPTVFAIGHKAIDGIFSGSVTVEEKVDGSQFSFGIVDGELECRSHGKQLILDAPEKMFVKAVATVRELAPALHPEWIYRGEYLEKPKHNTLAYDRTPNKHIIGFDIVTGPETYLGWGDKHEEFERLGLETVPVLFLGMVDSLEMFNHFLDRVSVLGGSKIEGVVVKNYNLFTIEKKVALGKYVSEHFKEIHAEEWRKSNPTTADIVDQLIVEYKTPARWYKAIQHLKEEGKLTESPADIGALMREVPADVLKECREEIMQKLFSHFWKNIQRGITAGLPEWYKQELAKSAFDEVSK